MKCAEFMIFSSITLLPRLSYSAALFALFWGSLFIIDLMQG
jgi:hypothetical protein